MSNQVFHGADGSQQTKRALAIFPGALGDLVCFLPALAALRRRRPVLILCKQELARLIGASTLAEAAAIEGREASWMFSASPPAEAADFFGRFASVDSFTGFGVPEVEKNLRRWQGTHGRVHPFRSSEPLHAAVHYLRCFAPEAPGEEPREIELPLRSDVTAGARQRLANRLDFAGAYLVIHPGSGGSEKRWSRAGFTTIAERWVWRGGRVIVLLGPAEQAEQANWRRGAAEVVSGLELVDVAVLLGASAAYLGNDSGVSHLAAAVGARGVVLFGPTDPARWRPLSPRIEALRVEPWRTSGESVAPATIDDVEDALKRAAGAVAAGRSA